VVDWAPVDTDGVGGGLHKGLWPRVASPLASVQLGAPALGDDTTTPLALLRRTAVEHNAATMRDYCAAHGVDLAPHGKTTMSPELMALQLAEGAWGMTAATIRQVAVLRRFGVDRIILANELVDPPGLRWLARELQRDPGLEFLCYVDSAAGVDLMTDVLDAAGFAGQVDVLVEVGVQGGRTGCRTLVEVTAVADRVLRSARLRLRGVAAFEGIFADPGSAKRAVEPRQNLGPGVFGGRSPETVARIGSFLEHVRTALSRLIDADLLPDDREAILTAGGSGFFDRVVEVLTTGWGSRPPVRVVLRSGCYLTHDHGGYRRMSPLDAQRVPGGLRPAIEVWGRVVSHPERGLAFADVGRRDVSHDSDLPRALLHRRRDDDRSLPLDGVTVTALNDQHAYLQTAVPSPLRVGDLVGFGISHPCTTFDKWRALLVVEDDDTIAGLVHTWF
jgi:D-serine deaminase-like pyridoxal phosphate-dependent protein